MIFNEFYSRFTKIYTNDVALHKSIQDTNIIVLNPEYGRIYILDRNDMPSTYRGYTGYIDYSRIPKTPYVDLSIRFYPFHNHNSVFPYLVDKSTTEIKSETINEISRRDVFTTNKFHDSNLIVKLEKDECGKYTMAYYINNNIINNIMSMKRESRLVLLHELVCRQIKKTTMEGMASMLQEFSKTVTIRDSSPCNTFEDPRILKPNIKLYDYQKKDIQWMTGLEKQIQDKTNTLRHKFSLQKPVNDALVLFNNTIFPAHLLANSHVCNTTSIQYYGGNLISQVGLGKTIISLYHILSSCYDGRATYDQFVRFVPTCNYTYKRGKHMGTTCQNKVDPNQLYCSKHKNSAFLDKRVIAFKNLENFVPDHFINVSNKFVTNATLIICPNQLCDQWVQEYHNKFVNDKRVILIVTVDQFKHVSVGDLLFADIVIVSYQFLLNAFYQQKYYKANNVALHEKVGSFASKQLLLESTELNTLHLFHWKAVYLDEVHEIQNHTKAKVIKHYIYNFNSTYKWNISGTPFANGVDSFLNILGYNTSFNVASTADVSSVVKSFDAHQLITNGINTGLINITRSLFRGHTKKSISNEYTGNSIRESVRLLEFTAQERNIYEGYLQGNHSKYSNFLVRLCCDPELQHDDVTKELIRNCKTLDEIQNALLNLNHKRMEHTLTTIERTKNELAKVQCQLLDEFDEHTRDQLRTCIGILKRKITVCTSDYENIKRTYVYLKSSIENIEEQEETCPICFDTISHDKLVITKCGHKFCWDCVSQIECTIKNQSVSKTKTFKCPSCNMVMLASEVYLLQDKQKTLYTDLDEIVNEVKSTKIGNIIHYLKHNSNNDNKIILFSQWDELLQKVGCYLKKYKINIVYCNGSIYKKKHAIQQFSNNPEINVIMLSSRNAASGINLTIANKIILLEPVYGNKDYRLNIESQAIGRADRIGQKNPIEIIRFIVSNTIEEDILKNNVEEDKLKQLSL